MQKDNILNSGVAHAKKAEFLQDSVSDFEVSVKDLNTLSLENKAGVGGNYMLLF